MFNSELHSIMSDLKRYEKQTEAAKKILDRQFAPSIIHHLGASVHKRPHKIIKMSKKITIRTEEEPKRVMAWAIAQRIREARETRGLRQEDLAKMSGIARPNIVRIERGRHVPTFSTLKKIADALHLDMNRLMAQPVVTPEDMEEFAGLAESGVTGWKKALGKEDQRS
jgi:transcriptional regulator with XRE-family HTH domain